MTRVQLGSTQLSGIDPNRLVVASDNLVFHPLFDPETLDYNLGLIMFRMAIILDGGTHLFRVKFTFNVTFCRLY